MDPSEPTPQELTELLEQAFSSLDEVASGLSAEDWDLATDCPGWSVKDNVAHIASYEAVAAGLAQKSTEDISHLGHVKPGDAFGEANEREVQARRPLAPDAVLEEYRAATSARIKHLRSLDDATWATDSTSFPWGDVPTKDILPIRILDVFFHEQDIRRATGRPGHMNGAVARLVLGRLTLALPRVVAKTAAAPDGSTVLFEIGPPVAPVAVEVSDGKGTLVERPSAPTATIACDAEAFLCLMGGRWSAERALSSGRVTIAGDGELATRVLSSLVVVP